MGSDKNDHLESLWIDLRAARKECDAANDGRVRIEMQIAKLIDCQEIGSKTVALESGRRVTIKRGVTYKANIPEIIGVISDLNLCRTLRKSSDVLAAPIKTKTTSALDEKGYEWYRENDKEAFAAISQHVEVKPRKTGVTITEAKTKP